MLTLLDIGAHLDMSESNAGAVCRKLGIDWKLSSLDEVRRAYIRDIRATAAGRTVDGKMLNDARARESLLKGDRLEMEIARDAAQLVDAGEMEQEWCAMIASARVELSSMATGLREKMQSDFGIDVPRGAIDDYIDRALGHLAGGDRADSAPGEVDGLEGVASSGESIDD